MKNIIIGLLLIAAGVAQAGQLDYTTAQVNTVVGDDIAQYGAGGYLTSSVTNTCTENVWEPVIGCDFTIPFVSGFSFVTNSTIQYDNGPRWFKFTGSIGIEATIAQTHAVALGLETNGVYLAGSTSGPREFDSDGQKGSVSFAVPIYLEDGDTVGLVIQVTDESGDTDVIINSWQSNATRY